MSETVPIISLIHGERVLFPWFAEFHNLRWLPALDFHEYLTFSLEYGFSCIGFLFEILITV